MNLIKKITTEHGDMVFVAIASLILAIALYYFYPQLPEYWQGFSVESAGTVLDIFLVVILIGLYEKTRRKKEKIESLKRRIDDFKKIKNDYGNAIIGSSIRQLAELGVTNIHFTGIELEKFSFSAEHDIRSLKGSAFSHGIPIHRYRHWGSNLSEVDFTDIDCSEVVFGNGNLSLTKIEDCCFWNTNLKNARFIGVRLFCSENRVCKDRSDWPEEIDSTEEGEPIYSYYMPMFGGADLEGVDFSEADLRNIDFRDAKNILKAKFTKTRGLETCFFDDGIREALTNEKV